MKKTPNPDLFEEPVFHEHQSLHDILQKSPQQKRSKRERHWEKEATPDNSETESISGLFSPRKKRRKEMSAESKAIRFLAQREHSKKELFDKLVIKEVPPEEAKRVVDKMAELDLQSETRFLESRVRYRVNSRYGPRKTQLELRQHGLKESDIHEEMNKDEHDWQAMAFELVERRYGEYPLSISDQKKAFDLLLRRGYTHDQAYKVIRNQRE